MMILNSFCRQDVQSNPGQSSESQWISCVLYCDCWRFSHMG